MLSEFSHRVAVTSDDLLGEAARSLAEGTRAGRVVVSVRVGGESVEAAAWPVDPDNTPSNVVSFPIEDGELTLGSLNVFLPAGQPLQDDDRRLAEQLASGMGLALRNQLLTERLEARVEELRASRRRLVPVQTAELLERLSGEADQAVDAMREFARGVYPPLLEAEGLASAISAQARRAPIPVTVDTDGIGRYPRDIEATTYFCVVEALRNIIQHADATQAHVALNHTNGSLEFQVADDGTGFDLIGVSGVGLTAVTDRLDALTGKLRIHTEPGNGTTLTGSIPVSPEVSA